MWKKENLKCQYSLAGFIFIIKIGIRTLAESLIECKPFPTMVQISNSAEKVINTINLE